MQASVVAERVWLSGQQLAVSVAWQLAPPASAGAEDGTRSPPQVVVNYASSAGPAVIRRRASAR